MGIVASSLPVGSTPDLSILWVALVAVFTSITAPLLLTLANGRQQRKGKAEDYARQDRVAQAAADAATAAAAAATALAAQQKASAEQAEHTAALLLENQRATAAAAEEVARLAAQTAERDGQKLDQIHVLVNSQMTAARQAELDQTRAMLVVLRRVTAVAALRGEHADPLDLAAITRTEARIKELEAILADRLEQLRETETQAAAHDIETGKGTP